MLSELRQLKEQARHSSHPFTFAELNPYPHEKKQQSGTAKGHYFHQDLLVARRIHESDPEKHVDIGSRVDGFVAHVATFRNIEVLDIRPLDSNIRNIQFRQADLISLPPAVTGYCDSLSCLHAIEHFGLGRYGDPIDFEGHVKGLNNLYTILKTGGTLYLSCPIGPQRIEFNAHRVFSLKYLLSLFEGKFRIRTFSFVDDRGDLHEDVSLTEDRLTTNCGCHYGCGIFEMEKI
jgi:hypothetical protein